MSSEFSQITSLKRPKLLVRAARLASEHVQRRSMLEHMFGEEEGSKDYLNEIANLEFEMNQKRKSGDAEYSIARHVTILAALMHEASFSLT